MSNGEFVQTEVHKNGTIAKYKFKQNDQFFSFQRMMQLFESGDENAVKRLSAILKQSGDAIFWECTPVSQSDFASKTFEFVVIPAPSLALRTVDLEPFSAKFFVNNDHYEDVISFENLGRDSTLVVPAPPHSSSGNHSQSDLRHMTHLASFLRHGDTAQIAHLFRKIGSVMSSTVPNCSDPARRFWLSTSGLGVSWLHIRVDTVPKYYNWKEYKV